MSTGWARGGGARSFRGQGGKAATRSMLRMAAKGKDSWKIAAPGVSPVLTGSLNAFLSGYWDKAPTAGRAMEFLESQQKGALYFDHFAFRTFGVDGCGIDSMAGALLDFGYVRRDNLKFEKKKLNAFWFAPPSPELPRIFVSELEVGSFPEEAQKIIRRYTSAAASTATQHFLSGSLGILPWPTPTKEDFRALAEVSEYAAWTLVNGYGLNHTTISVHNLSEMSEIDGLVQALRREGFALNEAGGVVKTSPDGGLRQASTVADEVDFEFLGGVVDRVSGPYIEFAQRHVLPEYAHLEPDQVEERHRRDGFEQGNADKIFESTQIGGVR